MDLAALEIFRTVALEGSVTRAAERLGRVQSNVTTRVQQLEEQLGATLFLREGRRRALPRRLHRPSRGRWPIRPQAAEEGRQLRR